METIQALPKLESKELNSIQIMGVVNITPDSFSDGGIYQKDALKKINELIDLGVTVIDIGAESTAPFNKAITYEEEVNRLKNYFIPLIDQIPKHISISIDTYKIENN